MVPPIKSADVENAWSAETCYPGSKDQWTKENPALGQCAITAAYVHVIYGGKIFCDKEKHHYYNQIVIEGKEIIVDLTADQFDTPVNYSLENETTVDYLLHSESAERAKTLQRYELFVQNLD